MKLVLKAYGFNWNISHGGHTVYAARLHIIVQVSVLFLYLFVGFAVDFLLLLDRFSVPASEVFPVQLVFIL